MSASKMHRYSDGDLPRQACVQTFLIIPVVILKVGLAAELQGLPQGKPAM